MILYKYLSFSTTKKILNNQSLWFSAASTLNDSFETSAGKGHAGFSTILGEMGRSDITENRYRILCLTRDPLSPIMWAHYADQNRGVVIGIDAALAKLEDEETCALPAQYGSMIYTRTKPTFPYGSKGQLPSDFPRSDNYDPNHLQFLQRNFLHKSAEWHYEEEVRILKTCRSLVADYERNLYSEDPILPPLGVEFPIPSESIKEIYIGPRFYYDNYADSFDIFKFLKSKAPHSEIYEVFRDSETWHMKSSKIEDWQGHLNSIYFPGC